MNPRWAVRTAIKWLAAFACGMLLAGAAQAANTAPVVDSVVAVTGPAVLVDHPALYKFYLHDLETASNNLQLSFSSSNPTLFPTANVVFQYFPFESDGQHWYMTLAPGFGQTGTATNTVFVSDGVNVTSTNFVLTVNPPPANGARFANTNAIGILSASGPATVYPSTVNVSGMTGTTTNVTVSVRRFSHQFPGDVHMLLVSPTGQKLVFWSKCGRGTPVNNVNATITDRAFDFAPLPDEFEIWSEQFRPTDRAGTYNSVTNNFPAPAPAPPYGSVPLSNAFHNAFSGQSPNGTWSLYVYDDTTGATGSIAGGWSLMVLATGSASTPTISDITDQATSVNTPTAAIPFTVGSSVTNAASLVLAGGSSNTNLVPTNNIVFGGSGSNRTVTITPATGLTGTSTITVTVRDGTNTASDSFVLTVTGPNTPPVISGVANQTVNEDTGTGPLSFTIGDGETAAASLVLGKNSSNQALVPTNNILFGGSGSNRTVTVTPAANQHGTATITLTVGDGQATTSTNFLLTVNAVNDAPVISSVPNQATSLGGTVGPLGFTIGDAETTATALVLGVDSSNPTLIPTNNIVLGGSGSNRTVSVTAEPGLSGTATITLSANDGTNTTSTNFIVTVSTLVSGTFSFTNASTIYMTNHLPSAANPYPSTIEVTGLAGLVSNVTVTLRGLTHTWTRDVDVLLVGPAGQKVMICSDAGNGGANNVTFTLSDDAAAALPLSQLVSGTYQPDDYEAGETLPAPAPAGPYASTLSTFNGQTPNGTWSLFVSDDGNEDVGTFAGGWSITITAVSDGTQPPVISSPGNQSINEDTATGPLNFTVGDPDTAAGSLLVTASSSNPALVPTNNIVFGGSGSNRTVTVTPLANISGSATINLTVSDGAGSASTNFVLTVLPVNDVPVITGVANQSINEDTATGPLGFIVGDVETPSGSLLLLKSSSNPSLVPTNNIVLGGSGSNRNVTITPTPDANGAAVITLTVSDGTNSTSTNFLLTVNPVNDAPTITGIVDQTIGEDNTTAALGFVIGDAETPAGGLLLLKNSSNPSLVPTNNIVLGGSGSNRTVTITPTPDASGTAVITFTVSDGTNSASTNFLLTVNPVNDAPTITGIANQTIGEDGVTAALGFVVGDVETAALILSVTGGSSNSALVPTNGIILGGSGSNRTVTITPAPDANGTALITLMVSDGTNSVSTNFLLTVNAVNDAPTITGVTDQTINEDSSTVALGFVIGDLETAATGLIVMQGSSNPVLVPTNSIMFGGTGSNRTVTITPAPDANGTAIIMLTVSDGTNSVSTIFLLTVNAVNDGPTITSVADQTIAEDSSTPTLGFVVGDVETAADSLLLTKGSSNPALVPTNGIVLGGLGFNRTVTVTPAPNASGTAIITLAVSDGTNSVSTNFLVTVNAVNDGPTITGVADQNINEDEATSALGFVVSDAETAAASLSITGGSSNPALVPTNNIVFGGTGSNRSVTITPAPDANGATVITLTVNDGTNSSSTNFLLTVNGVNDGPTITGISNQTITVGGTAGPASFTIGDVETPAVGLTVSGDSSNHTLVPTDNIVLGGSGSNRTVTIMPASNQVGSALITLSVSDGTSSTNTSFVFTVNRAALTVTVDNTNRVYGATNPIFTGTLAGLLPGDDITAIYSTEANTNSPIGDYVITFTLSDPADKLSKYVVTTNYGTLTLSNATLTVTAEGTNKIYGTGLSLTGFTANGLVNSDSVSSVVLESAGTNATAAVGSYAITVTNAVGVGLSNYTISYVGGNLEIAKKELMVRADDQSRIFGQTNPVFSIAYAGFVNGEGTNVLDNLPTAGTAATTASAPGGYAITLTGGSDNNYEFNLSPGTLTIAPLSSVRITSIIRLADNSIRIGGTGDTNFTYTMRASTNVTDLNGWLPIGTVATDDSGIFQYDDVRATNTALRFYRLEFP